MTQDTEEENRLLSGEDEGRSPLNQASVEAHREQTNAVRLDRRDGRDAVHLTRRGVLERLAGRGGRSGAGSRGAHSTRPWRTFLRTPFQTDPTKVLGCAPSPYGFRSQFETAVRWLFPTPVNAAWPRA